MKQKRIELRVGTLICARNNMDENVMMLIVNIDSKSGDVTFTAHHETGSSMFTVDRIVAGYYCMEEKEGDVILLSAPT